MRKITVLIFIMVLCVFAGCAGFKGMISNKRSLGKVESASSSAGQNEAVVMAGFNLLEDKRPKTDISYMTSIKERISTETLNALKGIQFFKDVHSPALETDDVVISGEIRKFDWEYYNTMISYIPGLNILPFFGLTSTRSRADVEIYLEFKNNKRNEVILKIEESFIKNNSYNMYSFNPDKANVELASCFSVVLNKIKDKILLNRNKILEAAKVESSKISKPTIEVKPAQETMTAKETKPPVEVEPQEETKPSENPKVTIPPEGQNPEVK